MQNTTNYCDESCLLENLDADVRAAVQEIQEEISSLMTNINRCLEQVQHDIKRVNRLNECLSCMVETMDTEIEELLSWEETNPSGMHLIGDEIQC